MPQMAQICRMILPVVAFGDPVLRKEAKEVEYPLNGSSYQKDEDKFMRLAICNRKVMERNGRPVYHIDMTTKEDE